MSSRDAILDQLRGQRLPNVEQPALDFPRQTFEDCLAQFEEVLQAVGGTSRRVPDRQAAIEAIGELPCYEEAAKIVSMIPDVPKANVELAGVSDPHDLHDVDLAILAGRFAVAENAAIWLDLAHVSHRVIAVLAQHLAVVVPADQIVATMHEAYARIAAPGSEDIRLDEPSFGLFLSGPSKTADIEQSLVIGAHGARSLTVLLVDEDGFDGTAKL